VISVISSEASPADWRGVSSFVERQYRLSHASRVDGYLENNSTLASKLHQRLPRYFWATILASK
jgi:hypothetical protein